MKPTRQNIEFEFLEDIADGGFKNNTDWGFEIRDRVEDVKIPRWGKVRGVGAEVTGVEIGDYILIEPLMWTESLTYKGDKYRFTNEEKVLAKSKSKPIGIV